MKERLPETLNTPGGLPCQSDPTLPAIGRLLADQEARWQKGERVLVETFIEQQPSLRDDARAVMGLIANEIVLRRKRGEAAPAEEYRQRFPQFASELDDHFAQQRTRVDSELPKTLHMDKQSPDSVVRALAGSPALPGTLAGYEIREVLGRGGMGVVYKAWQTGLNSCVALKMILAGMHAGMEDV